MSNGAADFWTDSTSVLFTSYWGWSPETWGTVGWTGTQGLSHRTKLLGQLSDPFITVVYVTGDPAKIDPADYGKIAGFYLVSHEAGDRDDFTHPIHHNREPDKWRHSLRAIRAFTYLPEYRLVPKALDESILSRARPIAKWGELLKEPQQVDLLRRTPWVEVEVYRGQVAPVASSLPGPTPGWVPAGPTAGGDYTVSGTGDLRRHLYILRLTGDAAAFLGRDTGAAQIFKVGLSASPELRRQTIQKSMPRCAFSWQIHRTTASVGAAEGLTFAAAVAGEYAMKKHLAKCAEHLGGEFYLATEEQAAAAWGLGCEVSQSHVVEA